MAYMMLILEPPGQRAERGVEQGKKVYQQMLEYAGGLKARGVLRAVESLATDARGVRVQVRDGRSRLVDGPFTEAKEMVGGFFLVDVPSREDALAIAAACPAAEWSTVEVRGLGPCFDDSR